MKTKILAVALLVAVTSINLVGCASTRTQESAGEYTDDSVVTTKVKTALLADESLKSLAISVKTYRGNVELSGFVNSPNQIVRALQVTRGVAGVITVKNALQVKTN
jgi:osmotically-inducible protein OsmY